MFKSVSCKIITRVEMEWAKLEPSAQAWGISRNSTLLCISTSVRMLAHALSWSKNYQKHSKMSKKVPFLSCAREAYKRLTKKNKGKQRKKFVGQRLGVTPNRWLTLA